MMGQGLAQQGAQQGQGGQPSQEQMMQLVQQVAQLLAQGVSPEELIQKGVSQQVIEMAMQMVQQQGGQNPHNPQEEQQEPAGMNEQGEGEMPQGLASRGAY